MNLAKLATRRPTLVLMVALAVTLLAAIAVPRLGMDLLPNLELPVVAVITAYPNADPEAVEQRVGLPIEGAVRSVSHLSQVHTLCFENVALTMATFDWGAPLDSVSQELADRLRLVRNQLPGETQEPLILKLDPAQLPLLVLGVTGAAAPTQLAEQVQNTIRPWLEQTPGVARVTVSGAPSRQVVVRYRPVDLQRYQISPSWLVQAIQYQNMMIPIGTLRDNGKEYPARVGAQYRSLAELRSLVIGRRPPVAATGDPSRTGNGPALPAETPSSVAGLGALALLVPQVVTVGDVATVAETTTAAPGYTRVQGKPAILLSVAKESGVNTMVAARAVQQTLARIRQQLPGLKLSPVLDQSQFIQLAVDNVVQSAWVGGVLAILVLFVFLADWLSPLIIGISIPLSMVATGVGMYLGGLTLNVMSLGGLALGVGMLVDNSIVVLESIFRHREEGEERLTAAIHGTGEVAAAVTASTLTTLAVFLPVVFVGGLAGQIFRELSVTVCVALAASLLVSLTVVPLLASRLLPETAVGANTSARRWQRAHWVRGLQRQYGRWLDWALDHKPFMLVVTVLALIGTGFAFLHAPVELLPAVDMGEFSVNLSLPTGTPPEITQQLAAAVDRLLLAQPEVSTTSTQVGARAGADVISQLSGTTGDQGTIVVRLRPRTQRRRTTAEMIAGLRPQIERLAQPYQAQVALSDQAELGGIASTFLGRQVTVELLGQDPAALAQAGRQVQQALAARPGLGAVTTSLEQARPRLDLIVEPSRALLASLTAAQVGLGVREALGGVPAGTLRLNGADVPIVVEADLPRPPSLAGVADLRVAGLSLPNGPVTMARVGAVIQVRPTSVPSTIERLEGQRIVTVKATPINQDIGSAGAQVQQVLDRLHLPAGVRARLGGVSQAMLDSFRDLRFAAALAVVLVYMVMAAQFESWRDPFIIILTVPLGAIGAFWAVFLSGHTVSIISLVGLVILIGIVVNNGIVLVDYANQLLARGLSGREAARTAGRVRLRPVLMTAITTVLGLVPMAASRGEAAELDRPLAIAVMGGLALATVLTLLLVPAMWEAVQSRRVRRENQPTVPTLPSPPML